MVVTSLLDRAVFREMEQRLRSVDEAYCIRGIPIVDYDLYTPYLRETFAAALDLIERKDPRRFRRVCDYLKGIVALPVNAVAGYLPQLQVCAVRFHPPRSKEELPKAAVWYGGILVHEATHGLIEARKIPYDDENRERIERLCFKEQHRFFKRLGLTPESLAQLEQINSFKPAAYQPKSFWQNWREIRRRDKAEKARQRESMGGGDRKA
jgi:hypothetical protein